MIARRYILEHPWDLFWRLRLEEFAFAIIAMVIAGLLGDLLGLSPTGGTSGAGNDISLLIAFACIVAVVYELALLYLPVCMLVFGVGRHFALPDDWIGPVGALTYVAHSAYFMLVFGVHLPMFYLAWPAIIAFNLLRPGAILRKDARARHKAYLARTVP
ncbi:MAG: hypothetical protein EP335_15430 [Alphaproteobacteria bacterium]|nr:MAG: hypothetical protein EP335_15430 [Alphaproteobacteria bacterium]